MDLHKHPIPFYIIVEAVLIQWPDRIVCMSDYLEVCMEVLGIVHTFWVLIGGTRAQHRNLVTSLVLTDCSNEQELTYYKLLA
jgi:hypothetical protein